MPALRNMPGDERIIEAWAHKGKKVAATSKRLIVRSAKGGRVRHRVHRVRRRQAGDVQRVRRGLVLGAGAGEQQPLRARADVRQTLEPVALQHVAIRLVGLPADRHARAVLRRSAGTLSRSPRHPSG